MAEVNVKLSRDGRLNDIKDNTDIFVEKGAGSRSLYKANTDTLTNSSLVWNIHPNENLAIDRTLVIDVVIRFTIYIGTNAIPAGLANGTLAMNYGVSESLQAYPFNQLINNITFTVNSNNLSLDQQNMMGWLVRFFDQKDQQEYFDTPTKLDNYFFYSDAVGKSNNPLSGYGEASNNGVQSRGTKNISFTEIRRYNAGAFVDNSITSTAITNYWEIDAEVRTVEPLLVSPLIAQKLNKMLNKSAMVGLNDFSINMSLDTTMSRFWCSGSNFGAGVPYYLSIREFSTPIIKFNRLSISESSLIPATSVLPYTRYRKFNTQTGLQALGANSTVTFISSNFNFDQVPDLLVLYVKRPLASSSPFVSSCMFPISELSINFNNRPNLLSDMDDYHLYKMSVNNGLNDVSYAEWACKTMVPNAGGVGTVVPSVGSIILINPSRDLGEALPLFTSNSSSGTFPFSYTVKVNNITAVNFPNIELHCWAIYGQGYLKTFGGITNNVDYVVNQSVVSKALEQVEALDLANVSKQPLQGGAMDTKVVQSINKALKQRKKPVSNNYESRLDSMSF